MKQPFQIKQIFLALTILAISATTVVFALGPTPPLGGYTPDLQVIDPDCSQGDPDCYVNLTPNQTFQDVVDQGYLSTPGTMTVVSEDNRWSMVDDGTNPFLIEGFNGISLHGIGGLFLETPMIDTSGATNGQVLTLVDEATGEVEYQKPSFVATIPLWQAGSSYVMNNTSGQDLSNVESGLDPIVYDPDGNIDVRLLVRIPSTPSAGTVNFQLRAHNGTTESYPITIGSGWTYASTQNGIVATSDWVSWSAGTDAQEVHLFGWVDSGSASFNSAYLQVRPTQ